MVFLTPSTDPAGSGAYAEMALSEWHKEFPDLYIAGTSGELILPWKSAVELAGRYRGGGFDNWRLPSIDEMTVIYEHLGATDLTDFMPGLFWSSTVYNENYAYYTMPYLGEVGRFVENKQHPGRFRPVRYFTDDGSFATIDQEQHSLQDATGDSVVTAPTKADPEEPWSGRTGMKPKLGSTGPGGGIVFWVDIDDAHPNFDYLEMAPPGWVTSAGVEDPSGILNTDPADPLRDPLFWVSPWESPEVGSSGGELPASDMRIGGGLHNTVELARRDDPLGELARSVLGMSLNGLNDWYLPSLNELVTLCSYVSSGNASVVNSCAGTTAPGGGLQPRRYLSSNAGPAPGVWNVDLLEGHFYGGAAGLDYAVRPIRGR